MNKIFRIIVLTITLFCFSSAVYADDNLVNIYFFHSNTCPHCKEENKLLKQLEAKYDNIKIYKYEIHQEGNGELLKNVANIYKINNVSTPFTVIGDKQFIGFSYEDSKKKFMGAIEYYSKYGYEDKTGKCIGIKEISTSKINKDAIPIDEYLKEYGDYTFKLPILGNISTKNLTLPLITVLLGLIDGFNPCAMWVLLFLISMLIGMENKKRMWILGISFLVASCLTYLVFMLAWLNISDLLLVNNWFRYAIAIVALGGGIFNLVSYLKNRKEDGCTITNNTKRKKILLKIKKFTGEKSFYLALIGVITLAVSVNVIELACSAGLPIIFTSILSMNNASTFENIIYISIYMLCFFLDDLVVFIIAMTTLKLTGISTKYGKISKLIGAILLVIIGFLLLVKPEWIMLNF